ncbi:FtsH protease activity modulator HflK [Sulfurirhabdus autotrophica]|uniref:Protein HflK n=1 Tax=Sulfurirhabdus autotrophica TaxID=1706046 RepID=A0A4R3Y6Z9_9PROT|nr:FtsH protease activity modulator HflK [Sulfurirhabdus autotrophica]TCV87392.1 protease FtsH subunit HflK [Sulfurirhabdus autotrophica]
MSSNEPQWGKKGNDGPPDLDELWRKFNQKLNSLLGGKGNGSGGGGTGKGTPEFNTVGGAGFIIVLLLLVWIASGFYIVNAGERGVVLRFGKFLETTQSGPRWHLPYPIESREIVNVEQVRTVEVGYRSTVKNKVPKESLMLTDDENIIDIQFAVQYILKNPEEYLFFNRSPDDAVLQAAETAVREIVGKNKMDFVLYEGRAEVAAKAAKLVQDILDRYKTGISISKVTMQNAQPPEQVQASFDDAVKAGQDRERLKSEGQAYANDVIPRARGAASRLAQESEGYKQRVIANAEGEASRFKQVLFEYNKAPGVTRDRIYLDTVEQMLSNTSKVLVDQKSGGSNLLYLPLDKLIQSTGTPAVQESAAAKPAVSEPATTPVNDNTWRSRDAFRSRDREQRP